MALQSFGELFVKCTGRSVCGAGGPSLVDSQGLCGGFWHPPQEEQTPSFPPAGSTDRVILCRFELVPRGLVLVLLRCLLREDKKITLGTHLTQLQSQNPRCPECHSSHALLARRCQVCVHHVSSPVFRCICNMRSERNREGPNLM